GAGAKPGKRVAAAVDVAGEIAVPGELRPRRRVVGLALQQRSEGADGVVDVAGVLLRVGEDEQAARRRAVLDGGAGGVERFVVAARLAQRARLDHAAVALV